MLYVLPEHTQQYHKVLSFFAAMLHLQAERCV